MWPAPSSCRNSKTAPSRARRKVVSNRCPKPLPQTVAPNRFGSGMRLRGDLPKWRASSLDWCANPSSSRDRGGRPPMRRVSVLCPAPSSSRDRGANPSCRNSMRGAGQYALFCRSLTPVTIVVQTVACSRCSRGGGAILLSTGYGRYRVSTPSPVRVCISPPSTSTT